MITDWCCSILVPEVLEISYINEESDLWIRKLIRKKETPKVVEIWKEKGSRMWSVTY